MSGVHPSESSAHPVTLLRNDENCNACGEEISDTRPGGNVDGLVVHSACFKCSLCDRFILRQRINGSSLSNLPAKQDRTFFVRVHRNGGGTLDFRTFYDIGGKPFCRLCYETKASVCLRCGQPVAGGLVKTSDPPGVYHPECFKCGVCSVALVSARYKVVEGKIFCGEDYHRRFSPRCAICGLHIAPSAAERMVRRFTVLDKNYHAHCFRCEVCQKSLAEGLEDCYPLRGALLCEDCHVARADGENSTDARRSLHDRRFPLAAVLQAVAKDRRARRDLRGIAASQVSLGSGSLVIRQAPASMG